MTIKYVSTAITFSEIPDEVSLCINISNCPYKCEGCHSPYLRLDLGQPLNTKVLKELIEQNKGITCVCFMGGDAFEYDIVIFSQYIKKHYSLKTAWYSGSSILRTHFHYFDYIKIGRYVNDLGGLQCKTTNQRLYEIKDITSKFWKND